ncbi:hypothetical protein JG688_00005888 [Phytophthora aleatoria]|uniref:Uncharacterized protein n=1 Tax=Phytophthora aleatoria TaxID=2496075 RepID=A0A8J5M9H8_9STRA|nr:hypothetical protein JG688_00005888 [Phytophthora aleatoria]
MQSRQAIAHERSRQKCQQKQEEIAAQHNRQRSRRKIEEMMMAYQKAHLDAEKTYKKMEHLERKQAEQMRNLDQLRLAVEGGYYNSRWAVEPLDFLSENISNPKM